MRFGKFGNGSRLKFCLKDIYTSKIYYCDAKNQIVELVIEK